MTQAELTEYVNPIILFDDFKTGDIFEAETDKASTLYRITYVDFYKFNVEYIKHIKFDEGSKFPNIDSWNDDDLNNTNYKITRYTREEHPEYYL